MGSRKKKSGAANSSNNGGASTRKKNSAADNSDNGAAIVVRCCTKVIRSNLLMDRHNRDCHRTWKHFCSVCRKAFEDVATKVIHEQSCTVPKGYKKKDSSKSAKKRG